MELKHAHLLLQVGSSLPLHIEKNFPVTEIHYIVRKCIYLFNVSHLIVHYIHLHSIMV